MSEYNRDSSDGVIVTPSRRLFLGSLVAGSTVGLSGCSLFDFLGGSGTSNTRTTSNNDFGFDFPDEKDSGGRLIKGKKSKSKSRKKVSSSEQVLIYLPLLIFRPSGDWPV